MTPRRWSLAAPLALAAVYLPVAVPLAFGPLRECDHCVHTYLQFAPIVPTVIMLAVIGATPGIVVSSLLTLALLWGNAAAARHMEPRNLAAVWIIMMPLIGIQAWTFALMLRA